MTGINIFAKDIKNCKGERLSLALPKHARYLTCSAGTVSCDAPVVICAHAGWRRRVLVERLERYGYTVTLEDAPKAPRKRRSKVNERLTKTTQ